MRLERQEEGRKIQESSYVTEQKNILNRVREETRYLGRKCARDKVLTARFRLGSETRESIDIGNGKKREDVGVVGRRKKR